MLKKSGIKSLGKQLNSSLKGREVAQIQLSGEPGRGGIWGLEADNGLKKPLEN